jgi:hypothetical protein
VDTCQKRDRARKNRQRRQDKEARRRERSERKKQGRTDPGMIGPPAPEWFDAPGATENGANGSPSTPSAETP